MVWLSTKDPEGQSLARGLGSFNRTNGALGGPALARAFFRSSLVLVGLWSAAAVIWVSNPSFFVDLSHMIFQGMG